MPIGAPDFREALRYAAETFHALRDILIKNDYATTAWAARATSHQT